MEKIRYIPLNHIYNIDCRKFLKRLPDNSLDSFVVDPPYELGFMGKSWDKSGIAFDVELWREVKRVLKPGGHLLAFGGTRTIHRIAVSIEDAGFEIRDQIQWVYNTGFPKAADISKQIDKLKGAKREVIGKKILKSADMKSGNYKDVEVDLTKPATNEAKMWEGWKTALKPSFEPIILARKPISEKTVAENVLKWGTGALNIDVSRIEHKEEIKTQKAKRKSPKFQGDTYGNWEDGAKEKKEVITTANEEGRFPANTITLDENSELIESKYFNIVPKELQKKASKKDRNSDYKGEQITGEEKEVKRLEGGDYKKENGESGKWKTKTVNNHPTVKPISLMEWLIKLITPKDGIVCDIFAGSGSTLTAARKLKETSDHKDLSFIGTELSKEYTEIARKRIGTFEEKEKFTDRTIELEDEENEE